MFQGCEGGGGGGEGQEESRGRVGVNVWGWAPRHLSTHIPHTETLSLILPSLGSA